MKWHAWAIFDTSWILNFNFLPGSFNCEFSAESTNNCACGSTIKSSGICGLWEWYAKGGVDRFVEPESWALAGTRDDCVDRNGAGRDVDLWTDTRLLSVPWLL